MDSDDQHDEHQHRHHQHNQLNSSLMRYRSAPSSYFANFVDGEDCEEFLHPARPSSPETERIFARFMSGGGGGGGGGDTEVIRHNSSATEQPQYMPSMKHETEVLSASQIIYPTPSQVPNHSSTAPATASASPLENSYRMVTSMTMDRLPQIKMGGGGGGGGNNSNLIRHSSSPAGLFSNINVENGYAVMRGMGNFGAGNGTNGEASFSSASRLKGQINFSSGQPSSSGLMTQISEIGSKSLGGSSPEDGSFGEGRGSDGCYAGFPIGSWDNSAILSENYIGLKRVRDDDRKTFSGLNASETQNGEVGNRPPAILSHHLSLPKTSAEMSAMEKFLQLQDSVPCKIRAKRGCATHPRSIAERVRRTRISERMRKLQELVPNMDKQTNTADMLDLAVDYIKELQKQVKKLSDNREKCTCSNKPKP